MSCLHRLRSEPADSFYGQHSSVLSAIKAFPWRRGLILSILTSLRAPHAKAEPLPEAPLVFTTLYFGTDPTFLNGIRGDNIVNYVVPDTSETGGLLYNLSTGAFSAFPVPTANGANYPERSGPRPTARGRLPIRCF